MNDLFNSFEATYDTIQTIGALSIHEITPPTVMHVIEKTDEADSDDFFKVLKMSF